MAIELLNGANITTNVFEIGTPEIFKITFKPFQALAYKKGYLT